MDTLILAENYLNARGYNILQRNFSAKQYGQIDLVVTQPETQRLVFVKVNRDIEELKIDSNNSTTQLDVISIKLAPDQSLELLEHFENVSM